MSLTRNVCCFFLFFFCTHRRILRCYLFRLKNNGGSEWNSHNSTVVIHPSFWSLALLCDPIKTIPSRARKRYYVYSLCTIRIQYSSKRIYRGLIMRVTVQSFCGIIRMRAGGDAVSVQPKLLSTTTTKYICNITKWRRRVAAAFSNCHSLSVRAFFNPRLKLYGIT